MQELQRIADRVEIDALRAEFTDAVMLRDRPRLAALFTDDGALRMPNVPAEAVGPAAILEQGERLQAQWVIFVQTSHGGTVEFDGDTATGRTFLHELARTKNGFEGQGYGVYHDSYRRTADGWKFSERVFEVRYFDTSPLGGSAPEQQVSEDWAAATDSAGEVL